MKSESHQLKSVRLDEVCRLVTDGTHDSPKLQLTGVPFIKGKHISGGFVDFENCDFITIYDHRKAILRSKPERGDILFSNIGSVGDAVYVRTNREFSIKNVALFKPDYTKVDSRYLYYVVIGPEFRGELMSKRQGVAQPFFSLEILRSHQVRYHEDIMIQRKIAAILSAYDDLIENNLRRIKILEEMAQNLYREWFVNFRFLGHQRVRFIDSPLGRIPEGWEVKCIGDTFVTVLGGTPSREKPEYWDGGTIPWINSGKVNERRIIEPSELITELALNRSASKLMGKGTTVLAITGATLGQVSYLEIETTANQSVVGITDLSGVRSEWIYLTICNRIEGIVKHASGGAQQHINKEVVNNVLVVLPPVKLALMFKHLIEPVFREIATLLFQQKNLRRTRDLLLPKLISGEVDVSKMDIVIPAETGG
ncbi:MAG: restriction endonuclease subunit S [Candidatus Aminicenantes bacterium]|nr:restriction endonuclease subunit S [Candidatus Aminicenantes bacterium]